MAASGNQDGYAITAQNYFSELFGSSKEAPTKQSISESRQKLHYQAFAYLLNKANMEVTGQGASLCTLGSSKYFWMLSL